MITDKKLRKAANDLYLEPYKDGKEFKWRRELESLSLRLSDVTIVNCAVLDSPDHPFTEEYREHEWRRLRAVGRADDRAVRLINEDGGIEGHFDSFDVSINPLVDPDMKRPNLPGQIFYVDDEHARSYARRRPFVAMELYAPWRLLEGVIVDIEKAHYREIQLDVYLNVFQSEVERSLSDPWMQQDYCIEKEHRAAAKFHCLSVINVASSSDAVSGVPDENWDDLNQSEDEAEQRKKQSAPRQPIEEIRDLLANFVLTGNKLRGEVRGAKIALFLILLAFLFIALQ
jgi:hypothetical protein